MNIKLNLPAEPFSGQIVTFNAPCDCANVTDGLSINGEIYTVCDAVGKCVTGVGGAWIKGAQVSVVLDCTAKKAYIQNSNYTPASHATDKNNPHGVTAEQVGARPNTWMPTASDVGARPANWMPSASDVGAVPTSRTVNGKALTGNISLSASDVSAVPTSRTVNGRALSSNISLSASDVGARASTWMPTASDVGAVPTSRTVNGKALSGNISLSASDVGARPSTWTPSASDVGAAASSHNHSASNINSGTLSSDRLPTVPVAKGGTGATTAAAALTNLGAAPASHNHSASNITSGTLSADRLPTIPMVPGVEYATTKRSNGKVVYAKKINFGQLPNYNYTDVSTGISGGRLESLTGTFFDDSGGAESYPIITSSGLMCMAWVSDGCSILTVQVLHGCAKYTGEFTIEYTKG